MKILIQNRFTKLTVCSDAIIRDDHILCGIDAARPHIDAVHAIQQSVIHPPIIPKK